MNEPWQSEPTQGWVGARWTFLPYRNSVLVSPQVTRTAPPSSQPTSERTFLPGPIPGDDALAEPPLPVTADDKEYSDLLRRPAPGSGASVVAATFYGPKEQEKSGNEDFALAATIKDASGGEWLFSAIADGVSNKTFWAARTARIACLVAYKVVRGQIHSGKAPQEGTLEELRRKLSDSLRVRLEQDRADLLELDGLLPNGWQPELYASYMHRTDLWYNSTLLVAVLGPDAGFLLWAGDGGIVLVKNSTGSGPEARTITEVMRSTDDSLVSRYVSLAVTEQTFSLANISYSGNGTPLKSVEVYLASDGVDRTLRKNAERLDYQRLNLPSYEVAQQLLVHLATQPGRELDNYSIAYLSRSVVSGDTKIVIPQAGVESPQDALPVGVEVGQRPATVPTGASGPSSTPGTTATSNDPTTVAPPGGKGDPRAVWGWKNLDPQAKKLLLIVIAVFTTVGVIAGIGLSGLLGDRQGNAAGPAPPSSTSPTTFTVAATSSVSSTLAIASPSPFGGTPSFAAATSSPDAMGPP